jgi:GntR family transcriptional regulator
MSMQAALTIESPTVPCQWYSMIFKLNPSGGQPLYLQLMQQVRLAIETGALVDGDLMPGIRTLAEELVISHTTVAKAYTELAREGLLDLRHGSGAYVCAKRRIQSRAEQVRLAQERVRALVHALRGEGLAEEEIIRMFESELLHVARRGRGA